MKMPMDAAEFTDQFEPLLQGYTFKHSNFPNGDFGDLERVELEGSGKWATVEFWSKGWLGFEVFDHVRGERILNVLLCPEDNSLVQGMLAKLIALLKE